MFLSDIDFCVENIELALLNRSGDSGKNSSPVMGDDKDLQRLLIVVFPQCN
jgi:hypothetical protein